MGQVVENYSLFAGKGSTWLLGAHVCATTIVSSFGFVLVVCTIIIIFLFAR